MQYEKYYELRWGWCYIGSNYCYNEYKVFLTEQEINEFHLGLINNPTIKVVWCKKIRIEDWRE